MIKTTSSENTTLNSKFSSMVYKKTITNKEETLADIFTLDDSVTIFQQRLGYTFNNIDLLIRALSHTSFVHEYSTTSRKSYERLEFLGDSILGSFVTTSLFTIFPNFTEGKLSKLRSALVNEQSLAHLGRYIGAGEFILLGKGELKSELNDSIISDVFEAIIGAITLDSTINDSFNILSQIIENYGRRLRNQDLTPTAAFFTNLNPPPP